MDMRSLNRQQYELILKEIWEHHRFGGLSNSKKQPCRHIKYIRPHWDMRDGKSFCIKFDDKMFDFRDSATRTMYDRIMSWLDGSEE